MENEKAFGPKNFAKLMVNKHIPIIFIGFIEIIGKHNDQYVIERIDQMFLDRTIVHNPSSIKFELVQINHGIFHLNCKYLYMLYTEFDPKLN